MASRHQIPRRCWVTLLTAPSYLPGVITLAYSLSLQKSIYPLVVLVTPSLSDSCLRALKLEAVHNPLLIIHQITPLVPPETEKTKEVAERFKDTWTKLRAFELTSYDTCIFLDVDIVVYNNIDELFETCLPGRDWIAACHICACNLDHDSWAPDDWMPSNCAHTPLTHPASLQGSTPTSKNEGPPHVRALLNGGLFLFHPSPTLWGEMLVYFNTSPKLFNFKFPDQDFLANFFVHRWLPLSWKYNALKTMRQWHPNIWRDNEVKALHYIVDKPWQKRIASDGIAGHLGRDGVTHSWWWDVYGKWTKMRLENVPTNSMGPDGAAVVKILEEIVAPELDSDSDAKQCEENTRKGFPRPIPCVQDEHNDTLHDLERVAIGLSNGITNGVANHV